VRSAQTPEDDGGLEPVDAAAIDRDFTNGSEGNRSDGMDSNGIFVAENEIEPPDPMESLRQDWQQSPSESPESNVDSNPERDGESDGHFVEVLAPRRPQRLD